MLIWGSKGRTRTVGQGTFLCPVCKEMRPYKRVEVARYFTLYFIPLFKTKKLGEYVECQNCMMTFKPDVIDLTRKYEKELENQRKIEEVFAGLEENLDSGVPVQAIAAGLLEGGVDEETAAKMVFTVTEGQLRTCPECGSSYKSSVSFCSLCGSKLSAPESFR